MKNKNLVDKSPPHDKVTIGGRKMKKSLTLKTVLAIFACVAMILVAGLTLAACGEKTNDSVALTPTSKVVDFGNRQDWQNSDDVTLKYLGDNKYEVTGTPATMSAEQGAAYGGLTEGSKYVLLSIKMEVGSTIVSGWKTTETADVAFGEGEGKDTTYDGVEGVKEYVLGLTNGEEALHADAPVWRIEITAPVEEGETATTTVYTIDFSAIYNA